MKQIIKIFLFSLFLSNYALAVEFRGVGSVTYEDSWPSNEKKNQYLNEAKNKACTDAFKKYVSSMEESKRLIFTSIEKQIYANLNNYISCNTVVEENIDEKNKKVTAVMKANIDTTRLDIEITKNSKVFAAESGDKVSIVVFFYSRTKSAQRSFDDKVSKGKEVEIEEKEKQSGVSSKTTETTGGSTLRRASVNEFTVLPDDSIKIMAGMQERFTKSRFKIYQPRNVLRSEFLKADKRITKSLEAGQSIPDDVLLEVEDALIEKKINYYVMAYFDVGLPLTDQATGNKAIIVTLSFAQITDLGGDFPSALGTISGVQMKGEGATEDSAKANALNLASIETGKRLIDLINSKGAGVK